MKIGVSAFAWTARLGVSHLDLLSKVRDYGFTALEIPMFRPSALPLSALRRRFEANALDCTVCGILPQGLNPISPERETRRRSIEHLKECVEASAEMGAQLLGGPLFAPIGYLPEHRPTEQEWDWAVAAFRDLGDLLDKNKMTLSIEPVNRSETFFVRTARQAERLCAAIDHPRVGVTIDTFHANIEEQSIPGAIESLGSRLRHLHLSENDRSVLGSGHIHFPEILEAAKKAEYTGYYIIEGFGFSPEEPSAPGALWADRSVSPEDVACRSLAYLRSLERAVGPPAES